MHRVFGDKRAVDWLLVFGSLEETGVECMQAGSDRIKQKDATPAANARRVAPPRKDLIARQAAEKRRTARILAAWQKRTQLWDKGPGCCESADGCGYYEFVSRVQCGSCSRVVCSWCHVDGFAVCNTCDKQWPGMTRMSVPAKVSPYQGTCCHWCPSTELKGCCYRCNRWLCDDCSILQRVPACVSCPAIHVPTGGMKGISLRINRVRTEGSSFHKRVSQNLHTLGAEADEATRAAGRSRLLGKGGYGYLPATRSGLGQVARAGQEYKHRRQEAGEHCQGPYQHQEDDSAYQ